MSIAIRGSEGTMSRFRVQRDKRARMSPDSLGEDFVARRDARIFAVTRSIPGTHMHSGPISSEKDAR